MSDKNNTQVTAPSATPSAPSLPAQDTQVDFGQQASGFAEPMPAERRQTYESRIRQSLDAQAAGAEKASQLFIR